MKIVKVIGSANTFSFQILLNYKNLPDLKDFNVIISTSSVEDFFSVVLGWIGFEARYLVNVVCFTMHILNNSRKKKVYVFTLERSSFSTHAKR